MNPHDLINRINGLSYQQKQKLANNAMLGTMGDQHDFNVDLDIAECKRRYLNKDWPRARRRSFEKALEDCRDKRTSPFSPSGIEIFERRGFKARTAD